MGTRRTIDCTENPSVRRSEGSASPITANRVGLAILDQAMARPKPAKATAQDEAAAMSA